MVLAYIETHHAQFKKSGLEALVLAHSLAQQSQQPCVALVLGPCADPASLSAYGADKILHASAESLAHFDTQVFTKAISTVYRQHGAKTLVLTHSANGKNLTGRLAVNLQIACISGVKKASFNDHKLEIYKDVFAGKAVAEYLTTTDQAVLSVMPNAIPVSMAAKSPVVEAITLDLPLPRTRVVKVLGEDGHIPLPEAELVVSAGRGMKGPENWGVIEDLAKVLGAATACSRPVADADWRPHHEHVGQTGLAIRPNLYIAIGISGAIQHLAGVNNSKVIVVINKDPEAPFFKAADYGVCADLFEVVPRLTEAIRTYKNK